MSINPETVVHLDRERAHAVFAYIGRESTPATLEIERHDRRARMGASLRSLGLCWGLAIAAVFLPLLHFVLVPGLLIAGVVLANTRWRQHATIHSVEGTCPACAAPIRSPMRQGAVGSIPMRCPACGRPLELRPVPAVIGP